MFKKETIFINLNTWKLAEHSLRQCAPLRSRSDFSSPAPHSGRNQQVCPSLRNMSTTPPFHVAASTGFPWALEHLVPACSAS